MQCVSVMYFRECIQFVPPPLPFSIDSIIEFAFCLVVVEQNGVIVSVSLCMQYNLRSSCKLQNRILQIQRLMLQRCNGMPSGFIAAPI